ncbi:Beta-xylanase [Venustampulla echinocandica]|uniref:Beta-xylanase n=1 Tax=Venustampulla echinocandica TaxID=2656787 RepID=A0A370TZI1_9HELO|nr:Beta-xylanase [Venustampulla echinocandica]RDL40898.1 Beta-xylanase [Venustampulla echinocandica]
MRSSIISGLVFAPILVAHAAPSGALEAISQIDWERELLGESGNLEKRARSEQSIDAIFKSLGKLYFGTCADSGLLNNGQNAEILKADFGQLTPENSGKWDTIESSQNNFNFGGLDTLVNWAQSNNKLVRGHTTVWHSQLPGWVQNIRDKNTLTAVIQKHVSTEIGRYAGKVLQWDVVNEMFDENGGLRGSVFSNVLGEDFVRIAFEAARKADPNAKLYINDYNTVEKGSNYGKTTGMIKYVTKWIAAGVPIDGIGAQAHLMAGESKNVKASLTALCAVASECALTEVDIVGAAANEYVETVKACVDIKNCVGVTVWGVRDPDSWRASQNPLLFNSGYQPKPAYNALVSTLAAMKPAATPRAA